MNHVSTIVLGSSHDDSEKHAKKRTWAFVAGVMALYYQDVNADSIDGIKQTCIMYHAAITGFGDKEYSDRLMMIRKICEVPNMPGLYGRYRNAQDALRVACGELCNLQHDFGIVQPKNYSTGALEEIKRKELEHNPQDDQKAKDHIKKLKEIF